MFALTKLYKLKQLYSRLNSQLFCCLQKKELMETTSRHLASENHHLKSCCSLLQPALKDLSNVFKFKENIRASFISHLDFFIVKQLSPGPVLNPLFLNPFSFRSFLNHKPEKSGHCINFRTVTKDCVSNIKQKKTLFNCDTKKCNKHFGDKI